MSEESFKDQQDSEEPIWTYKGYGLKSSEFVSAMAHEFRAEIHRTNTWRTRIDATTNWAVVVTGVSISIAFSQPKTHHGVIMLNALLITLFLYIEARRYLYYEFWNYRVRLMETDFFAAMLVPPFRPSSKWADNLADNVLHFHLPISIWEAIGLRLRQNYLWIFFVTGVAWVAKYWLFPTPAANWPEFISRAAVGPISGPVVVGVSLIYFSVLILVAIFTLRATPPTSEVLPPLGENNHADRPTQFIHPPTRYSQRRTWLATWKRQQQFLAFVTTTELDAVAKSIMSEIKRGVTAVPGEEKTMLICALRGPEINSLKAAVAKEDPQATINVLTAQEVFGRGFDPLSIE